jgi:hypothetical protein
MCCARDLPVYKLSKMPFSLSVKLLDFPFEKITWRLQYYENAIQVGVVQLDLKMHSSTPWVCSRLLLIIHEHSHFHRRRGFVRQSPVHVHCEMNGIKLSPASTAWKLSTSPGISGPSQYITRPPTTGNLYPVQLVWTIQLFAPIKGSIDHNWSKKIEGAVDSI